MPDQHGRTDDGVPWPTRRGEVLDRDGHECQFCSRTGTDLRVHHVHKDESGGSDAVSNLVTLCKDCHNFAHRAGDGDVVPVDVLNEYAEFIGTGEDTSELYPLDVMILESASEMVVSPKQLSTEFGIDSDHVYSRITDLCFDRLLVREARGLYTTTNKGRERITDHD